MAYNKNPIYVKDRPNEVKHSNCSSDKARKLLNYKTSTSLEDGIKKTFKWYLNNQDWCENKLINSGYKIAVKDVYSRLKKNKVYETWFVNEKLDYKEVSYELWKKKNYP